MTTKLALIVHGGAGMISQSRIPLKLAGVQEALRAGYDVLKATNNSVDAVEAAIKVMELDEAFNAGYGSVLTSTGEVEMDAILIRGSEIESRCCWAMRNFAHPISVSKAVMEKTPHTLLVGAGAEQFAEEEGFPIINSEQLIAPFARDLLKRVLAKQAVASTEVPETVDAPKSLSKGEGGTVGAVAINSLGEIAAGTSTGGITAKLPGRVGDTPIIGGGTFCDDAVCGASATGLGEAIMRVCVCSRIANALEQGERPNEACLSALNFMTSRIPEGDGGAIVITKNGEVGYNFNSNKMAWAYIKGDENVIHYGIEKGDDFTVPYFDS
ncbi:putative isoaspartyl peptidase/L-asparaginase [Orchesella cincta]|uniref:Putative isoaspartyl peptidase/L-asparaginase n=1 Tax=Orchesella cincta TaxID=48709 RepID=A0A1D2MQT0_ORCCI|nr:putative isoaspartyl peptidase/L-asparaginase [Orchesella cincta]